MSTDLLDLPDLEATPVEAAQPHPAQATPVAAKPITPTPAVAKPAKRAGPTKKAIAQYREAVQRAVESGATIAKELVFAAYKTVEICNTDFKTYRNRLQAKHALAVTVPELERKAAEAEKVAAAIIPYEKRTMTFAEWEALRPRILFSRRTDEDLAAQQARQVVSEARQAALQHLRETSDPELARQISELAATASSIRGTMAQRQKGILNIDAAIAKQREMVDAIIRGDDLVEIIGPVHKSRREENDIARRKLDYLLDQAQGKPQAEIDQAADQQRLAEIAAEISKLEQARLDPRRMRWA